MRPSISPCVVAFVCTRYLNTADAVAQSKKFKGVAIPHKERDILMTSTALRIQVHSICGRDGLESMKRKNLAESLGS